jgi:phospholipid transport system transporter-binding protein
MLEVTADTASLAGPVTLANVNAVLAEGRRLLTAPALTVDLAGVTEVDSTCVSLLLEWRRDAQRARRTLRYTNLPHNLKSLMTLYGVSELLA